MWWNIYFASLAKSLLLKIRRRYDESVLGAFWSVVSVFYLRLATSLACMIWWVFETLRVLFNCRVHAIVENTSFTPANTLDGRMYATVEKYIAKNYRTLDGECQFEVPQYPGCVAWTSGRCSPRKQWHHTLTGNIQDRNRLNSKIHALRKEIASPQIYT